jgi:hypothetical protein
VTNDPNHCAKGHTRWVSRAGSDRSRGGESGVHVSSVVGPPLDRAFGLSRLLEKGDGGVKTEESKYASHATLDFHSALHVAIGVVLDNVWGDEGSRGAVSDGRARIVPVLVLDCCEVHEGVRM